MGWGRGGGRQEGTEQQGRCRVCKSPPTGKNGGVYFLDILERSRKPELVLVGQWIWSQGLERPEGAQKGRLTFSEAKGVLGDPGRPGDGLEVRLWVLMVAASLSGTCLSLGYQPVLAASSNPESSWGSGVLGAGGEGGTGTGGAGKPLGNLIKVAVATGAEPASCGRHRRVPARQPWHRAPTRANPRELR